MCQCEPIVRLSVEGTRFRKILQILFFVYLIFLVGKIVVMEYQGLLTNILAILILLFAFIMCHYLLTGITIFFVIFSLFYSLIFIGLRIQSKVAKIPDKYAATAFYTAGIIVVGLSIFFYFVLTCYLFQAYKEFKALYFEGSGLL